MKKRLDALAESSQRSKSFLAAEAIAANVEAEEWQFLEIQSGVEDVDKGRIVGHGEVSAWLNSWGKKGEKNAP